LPELLDLVEDWRYNPPLVSLVEALVLGLSGQKKRKRPLKEFNYDDFIQETGGKIEHKDGSSAAIFDMAEMRRRNAEVLESRNKRRIEAQTNVRDSA